MQLSTLRVAISVARSRRDERLRRLGYRVVRVGAELVLRHPESALEIIRAALG
jgi:very-short-patch-repair endonuclease